MISVIMPVFNTEPYLKRAIESVLNQTYQDWELILVDDGSFDSSEKLCDIYAEKDSRIKVIHQRNEGVSVARNIGIQYASGEFIQFLDSDDWLYPETLQTVYDTLISSGSDMVIFDVQYEGDNFSWHEKSTIPDGIYDSEVILEKLAKPSIPPYACNKFCKCSLYENVLFPKREKWEDAATTFYPVSKATKITVLGKPLYHYWQRVDSITKSALKDGETHKWRFLQYKKRYEFLKRNYPHLTDTAKESVLRNGLLYYAVCLNNQEKNDEVFAVYKFLCSEDFDDGVKSKKLMLARIVFKLWPRFAAFLIRKKLNKGVTVIR